MGDRLMDNFGAMVAGTLLAFAVLLLAPIAGRAVSNLFKFVQSFR